MTSLDTCDDQSPRSAFELFAVGYPELFEQILRYGDYKSFVRTAVSCHGMYVAVAQWRKTAHHWFLRTVRNGCIEYTRDGRGRLYGEYLHWYHRSTNNYGTNSNNSHIVSVDMLNSNQLLNCVKYVDGKRHGTSTEWYPDGTMNSCNIYMAGMLLESKAWHKNGALWYYTYYEGNKKHGLHYGWKDAGQLIEQLNYEDGKLHGQQEYWYLNGQMSEASHYVAGLREGEHTTYDVSGVMIWHYICKSGESNVNLPLE